MSEQDLGQHSVQGTPPEASSPDPDAVFLTAASKDGPLSVPGVRDALSRALAVHLEQPTAPSTAERLIMCVQSLTDIATPSPLLTFVSRVWEDPSLLGGLEALGAEPAFLLWIRELSAAHSRAIRLARLVDGQSPEGWVDVSRAVFYEEVEARWMVQINVTRIDGAVVSITDEVQSMLLLGQIIIDACGILPIETLNSEPLATRVQQVIESAQSLAAPVADRTAEPAAIADPVPEATLSAQADAKA